MNILDAIVLGIVEGLTEFLPVSSTGHLILAGHILHLPDSALLKSFDIAIQLGAVCAVLALYWKKFLDFKIIKRLLAAFIPTAAIGLLLYSFVKTHLLGNETVVLSALAIGGVALVIFEKIHREPAEAAKSIDRISYRQAFGIGIFQSLALVPGVSRSAASIVGGLLLGLRRTAIVEFSFLLAVPTMLAATSLDLWKNYTLFSGADFLLIGTGFLAAFLVALVVIKFFLRFIKNHTFIPFGIYRILLATLFWLLFIN